MCNYRHFGGLPENQMATSFEQIQIDRETIGKALREKRLRVDTHQREYAWEEDPK